MDFELNPSDKNATAIPVEADPPGAEETDISVTVLILSIKGNKKQYKQEKTKAVKSQHRIETEKVS